MTSGHDGQWSPPSAPGPVGAPAPAGAPAPTGTWIGVALSVALLGNSLLACLATGIVAANESETFAVQVSYVTVPMIAAGLVPWIVALLTRKKSTAVAVGAPLGCGCLSWAVALVATIAFFALVWDSL
jgi:hypothetical protein